MYIELATISLNLYTLLSILPLIICVCQTTSTTPVYTNLSIAGSVWIWNHRSTYQSQWL